MMFIEIWLTVLAWRKGWKGYALLPMGVSFSLAFLTGIVVGLSGGSVDRLWSVGILLEVCVIVALILMVNRQPNAAKAIQSLKQQPEVVEKGLRSEVRPAPQMAS
jgi:hypothetical protein